MAFRPACRLIYRSSLTFQPRLETPPSFNHFSRSISKPRYFSTLKYLRTHEYVRLNPDGTATIGITDYAQSQMGDVVFVDLPADDIGKILKKDEIFANVESVKAAADVYMPITGELIAVNHPACVETPEVVNESPFDKGWFIKVKPTNLKEMDTLLDGEAYKKVCEEEESHK